MYIYFFLVIAKTEELSKDMEFIGQMANVSFITTLGDEALQLLESRNYSKFGFQ